MTLTRVTEGLASGTLSATDAAGSLKDLGNAAEALQGLRTEESKGRHEVLRTAATAIVPLLTLLTLATTIWIQSAQTRIQADQAALNHRSAEDVAWREMIGHMANATKSDSAAISTAAELETFFTSERYASAAARMAFHLLPRISDADSFKDLLTAALGAHGVSPADMLSGVLAVDRDVAGFYWDLQAKLKELGEDTTTAPAPGGPGDQPPMTRDGLNHLSWAASEELRALSEQIGPLLRASKLRVRDLNFDDLILYHGELRDIDFSGAKLGFTRFWSVDVKGAKFTELPDPKPNDWWSTAWWEAAAIDAGLLTTLAENWYPYVDATAVYASPPPGETAYRQRLDVLARGAKVGKAPYALRPASGAPSSSAAPAAPSSAPTTASSALPAPAGPLPATPAPAPAPTTGSLGGNKSQRTPDFEVQTASNVFLRARARSRPDDFTAARLAAARALEEDVVNAATHAGLTVKRSSDDVDLSAGGRHVVISTAQDGIHASTGTGAALTLPIEFDPAFNRFFDKREARDGSRYRPKASAVTAVAEVLSHALE